MPINLRESTVIDSYLDNFAILSKIDMEQRLKEKTFGVLF